MAARKPSKKSGTQGLPTDLVTLFDLEAILAQLTNPLVDDVDEDMALDRAKEIYYQACDAPTARKRLALARKAIEISPLCADAFVMLAEHEEWASNAQLALYQQALEAGKKSIGSAFAELEGEFWGWIETRPFMRAKLGLAICLWHRGEREEALTHLRELLKLNPNDNQGVRSILVAYLLEMEHNEELAALLKKYKDDTSADLGFSRSLLAFRLHGDAKESRKLLSAALEQNKHVKRYLIGDKLMPESLPPFYSWGDDSEAVHYVSNFKKGWEQTPGAIDWLRNFVELPAPNPASAKRARRRERVRAGV